MDTITIVCSDNFVKVEQGRLKGSRHRYHSPVIDVYVAGRIRPAQQDMVKYHAVSEALKRGGRAIDVKRVPCACGQKKPPVAQSALPEFFDDERGNVAYECSFCGKPCISIDSLGHCPSCRQIWHS